MLPIEYMDIRTVINIDIIIIELDLTIKIRNIKGRKHPRQIKGRGPPTFYCYTVFIFKQQSILMIEFIETQKAIFKRR